MYLLKTNNFQIHINQELIHELPTLLLDSHKIFSSSIRIFMCKIILLDYMTNLHTSLATNKPGVSEKRSQHFSNKTRKLLLLSVITNPWRIYFCMGFSFTLVIYVRMRSPYRLYGDVGLEPYY